jgi:hypothetical protein
MSERTPGEWNNRQTLQVFAESGQCIHDNWGNEHWCPKPNEEAANCKTIALAGTIANRLDDLGYDGEACIERLPEILAALEFYAHPDRYKHEMMEVGENTDSGKPVFKMTCHAMLDKGGRAAILLAALKPKGDEHDD